MIKPLISDRTLEVGQRAWEHFLHGLATGDYQSYIDMLSDDFTFSFPVGPLQGRYVGREGKECMLAYCQQQAEANNRLKPIPHHVTYNENTVVFEYDTEGIVVGKPYKARGNAISFDVSGDKISGFREYFGDLDLNFLNAYSDAS